MFMRITHIYWGSELNFKLNQPLALILIAVVAMIFD